MSTPGPDAWSNLDAVYTLYDPCGVDLPDAALVGLDSMIGLMELFNVSYAQQASMNAPLPCTSDTLNRLADWFTEAGYQHGTGTYMALLGGVSVVLPPNLVDQRRPRRRIVRHRLPSHFKEHVVKS
jgi:hypothetical protein